MGGGQSNMAAEAPSSNSNSNSNSNSVVEVNRNGTNAKTPLARSKNRTYVQTNLHRRLELASIRFEDKLNIRQVWEAMEHSKPAVLCCTNANLELSRERMGIYQVPDYMIFHNGGKTVVYCHIAFMSYKVELGGQGQPDPHGIVWVKVKHPFPFQLPDSKKKKNGQNNPADVRFSAATIIVVCLPDVPDDKKQSFANHLVDSLKSCRTSYFHSQIIIMGSSANQLGPAFFKDMVSLAMADNDSLVKLVVGPCVQGNLYPFSISIAVDMKWETKLKGPSLETVAACNNSLGLFTLDHAACLFCCIMFCNRRALKVHMEGYSHQRNYAIHMYRTIRETMISGLADHKLSIVPKQWLQQQVSPDGGDRARQGASDLSTVQYDAGEGQIMVAVERGQLKVIDIVLNNIDVSGNKIIVSSIEFLNEHPLVILSDAFGITKPVEERANNVKVGIRLAAGGSLTFQLVCDAEKADLGTIMLPLAVTYKVDGAKPEKHLFVGREVVVEVVNEEARFLAPTSNFQPTSNWKWRDNFHLFELQQQHKQGGAANKAKAQSGNVPLAEHPIPNYLVSLLMHGMKPFVGMDRETEKLLARDLALLDKPLSQSNYGDLQNLLLFLEEFQLRMDLKSFDMTNVELKVPEKNQQGRLLRLEVPGLAENRPSVLKGDIILVASSDQTVFQGEVKAVMDTEVSLDLPSEDFHLKFLPKMKFDIRFTFNRHSMRILHRAIESIAHQSTDKLDFLFPNPDLVKAPAEDPDMAPHTLTLFNRNIGNNERQLEAVTNILFKCMPKVPYLVFGPPGTGKTSTLLEAIKQVWSTKMETKLLVTAPSNEAVDLLASRLLEHVPEAELLRIYALSRSDSIPTKLMKVSNISRNIYSNRRDQVEPFRIVLVTLVSSGLLHSMGMSEYFTHVFVDEAGHGLEAEIVTAISGALHPQGQLVLAGDPQQLQPIIRSKLALKCNFDRPLLKRLMDDFDIYKKDEKTGNFNSRFTTKLLNNYRSHEKLLRLPSSMFYDGELVAAGSKVVTSSLENWDGLPTKGFPYIFHAVNGKDERESKSPSFFNVAEVVVVVDYVQSLLLAREGVAKKVRPEEIGVISPYKKQVAKIKELMDKRFGGIKIPPGLPQNWKDVTVGSTEMFQGQERRVIILSTVRSSPWHIRQDSKFKLGFLNNPKRFNVAITRAKALMIVVGNPNILMLDHNWCFLLRYVKENGGCKGFKFSLPNISGNPEGDSQEMDKVKSIFDRMSLDKDCDDVSSDDESSEDEEHGEGSKFERISSIEAQMGPPQAGLQE